MSEHFQRPYSVPIDRALTGNWENDEAIIRDIAQTPATAKDYYAHTMLILSAFNILTHRSRHAAKYPIRQGLVRKVYDELFPISYFATLHYELSSDVKIQWEDGNQSFDAKVVDQRDVPPQTKFEYLEVTTLQSGEDAKLLKDLASWTFNKDINGNDSEEMGISGGIVCRQGNLAMEEHLRKVALLKKAILKKCEISYPKKTALLIYTDEDRARTFTFGAPSPIIDKKKNFEAALNEMKHLLIGFSEVFVYSKNEIYCRLEMLNE